MSIGYDLCPDAPRSPGTGDDLPRRLSAKAVVLVHLTFEVNGKLSLGADEVVSRVLSLKRTAQQFVGWLSR